MSHGKNQPRLGLGIAIALLAYVFFVTGSSLVWSFKRLFPIIQIIFVLNFISLISILPLALRKGVKRLKTKILPVHLLRDIPGVSSYFLYFIAIRYLNLTDATILNNSAPFFVPIVWWIWMREKLDRHVWWSIIVGFVGVAVILNPSKQIFQEGFAYGLSAGILSAVGFTAIRVLNLKREPMTVALFYFFFIGSLLTAPFAWIYWIDPTLMEWVKMIGIGASTIIAQMLLTIAYRYGTASFLSPLAYSSVVYAGVISWLVFGISPGVRSLVGTLLIITGGTLTYIFKKKPGKLRETFEIPNPKEKPPL